MKKIVTLLLALAMATSMVACSGGAKEEATDTNSEPEIVDVEKTDAPVESIIRSEELGEPMASYSTDMLTFDFYKTVESEEYKGPGVFSDVVYVNAIITNNSSRDVLVDGISGWDVEEKIIKAGTKKQVTVNDYLPEDFTPDSVEMIYGYMLEITSPDAAHTYERVKYNYSYDENLVATGFASFEVDEWGMPSEPEEDENESEGKSGLSVLIGENEYVKAVLVFVERSKSLDAEAFGIDSYRYDYVVEITNKTDRRLNARGTTLPAGETTAVTDVSEDIEGLFEKDDIYVSVYVTDPSNVIQTGKGTGPNGEDEFEEEVLFHEETMINWNNL